MPWLPGIDCISTDLADNAYLICLQSYFKALITKMHQCPAPVLLWSSQRAAHVTQFRPALIKKEVLVHFKPFYRKRLTVCTVSLGLVFQYLQTQLETGKTNRKKKLYGKIKPFLKLQKNSM